MITASHPLNKLIRFDPVYWIPEPAQSLHGLKRLEGLLGDWQQVGIYTYCWLMLLPADTGLIGGSLLLPFID